MRLTCPRCAAQYEIAQSAIPALGREVECSACGHVWREAGPGKSGPSDAAGPGRSADPDARPVLNRPLDESILAILREEAQRELRAREAETRPATRPGARDHIPATGAGATPPAGAADPDQPMAATTAGQADWPAVTVTAPPVATEPPERAPEPAEQRPPDLPRPEIQAPDPGPGDALPPDGNALPEAAPPALALPDAEELAATLTRSAPRPAAPLARDGQLPPVPAPLIRPAAAGTAPEETVPQPPREAPVPALVTPATPRRGGYVSGFGLAAMLALGVMVLYALAPQVAVEEGGGWLAEWRERVDRGRLWLHDRILDGP